MKRICAVVVVFLAMAAGRAIARPMATEEWCPAGPGSFGFEAGYDSIVDRNGEASRNSLVTIVYGLSETTEFAADFPRVETGSDEGREVSGMADISLHLKHCVYRQTGPWPGIAVKSTVKLATGNREEGLGSGDEDVGFALMVSRSRDGISLRFMTGYVFAGNRYDPSRENFIRYGAGFTVSIDQRAGIFAEVYGESCDGHAAGAWDRHLLRPLAGAMYEVYRGMVLDAAVFADFVEGGIASRGISVGMTFSVNPEVIAD